MPFDGLPDGLLSDMAKLRVALDGVRNGWVKYAVSDNDRHCAVGWLYEATDRDPDETVRLALDYVYPALPENARGSDRMDSIVLYNDGGGHKRVVKLFADAVRLAESRVVID